jgi:hypothetical protein
VVVELTPSRRIHMTRWIQPRFRPLSYGLRVSRRSGRWFDHPTRTAWDHFFCGVGECWIIFHLKDGKIFGDRFGGDEERRSFVSTFPQEPEIYVKEAWRVDENGRFIEKVQGTLGILIRFSECQRLEFLTVEEMENGPEEVQSTAVESVRKQAAESADGTD